MLHALLLAFVQLPRRGLRGLFLITLAWTLTVVVMIWAFVFWALVHYGEALEVHATALGLMMAGIGLALVFATWFLFVAVESAILFCYADRIAWEVERTHYPALGPAPSSRWRDALWSSLRLMAVATIGNVVFLPLYLLVPGANLVLFLGLNGYLFGRACFDAVVLRRMDDRAAKRFWADHKGVFIVNGIFAVILLAVPLLNLVIPIVGLAATVHLVQRHRPAREAS